MTQTPVKRRVRRAAVAAHACVACGSCVHSCPRDAVRIVKGSFARINHERCVGCGKCSAACPASVVEMETVAP